MVFRIGVGSWWVGGGVMGLLAAIFWRRLLSSFGVIGVLFVLGCFSVLLVGV